MLRSIISKKDKPLLDVLVAPEGELYMIIPLQRAVVVRPSILSWQCHSSLVPLTFSLSRFQLLSILNVLMLA